MFGDRRRCSPCGAFDRIKAVLSSHQSPALERFSREEFAAVAHLDGIARARHEDLAALHGLWAAAFLGIALRMLDDRAEAEEAVQDTFVRIWAEADRYPSSQCRPFVWGFTILRSRCLDRLRKRSRKRRIPRALQVDLEAAERCVVQPELLCRELQEQIGSGLAALGIEDRRCLELYVFQEFTQEEISNELSSPLGTVKTRLRRALQSLRQHLNRHEN